MMTSRRKRIIFLSLLAALVIGAGAWITRYTDTTERRKDTPENLKIPDPTQVDQVDLAEFGSTKVVTSKADIAWILALLNRTTKSPPQRGFRNLGLMRVVMHTRRDGAVDVAVVQSVDNRKFYITRGHDYWPLDTEDFRQLMRIN
jgi:hypothetical protein